LQLWLGGSPNQTRLAKVFAERVKLRDLESTLEPMLAAFKSRRRPGEAFGDFVARVGFAALRSYADSYVPADKMGKLPTVSAVTRDMFFSAVSRPSTDTPAQTACLRVHHSSTCAAYIFIRTQAGV
jgi:hypothetical protein